MDRTDAATALLRRLPDVPRWVEARGMLLSERGRPIWQRRAASLVWCAEARLAVLVGRPDVTRLAVILAALPPRSVLLVPEDEAEPLRRAVTGWSWSPAILHGLPAAATFRSAATADAVVRFVASEAELASPPLSRALAAEMRRALRFSPLAAAFVDDRPVSFCYAAWETETLVDVSIDTLAGHRRKGLGRLTASHLIAEFLRRGKHPVWGALATNIPSLRLAASLGFRPVDRLIALSK